MKPKQNNLKIKPIEIHKSFNKLKSLWYELASKYKAEAEVVESYWVEIYKSYNSPKRFYHNLNHLEYMFEILAPFKHLLKDSDAVYFSIWFHDIVYNSSKRNNEEQSALKASEILIKLNVPVELKTKVEQMILTTKSHMSIKSGDFDTNILLDADLAILGSDKESYIAYSKSVRKEYGQYPDLLYNPGRKKVLQQFLHSDYIYKTEEMRNQFEAQARTNISFELNNL
jgi:predicted metal-dependent HD superfamily phosphohydrolase